MNNKSGDLSIAFTTADKDESHRILSSALEEINNKSKNNLLRSIRSDLNASGVSRKLELELISNEFEGLLRLYEVRRERSLTLLREQADVARELGIEGTKYTTSPPLQQAKGFKTSEPGLTSFESDYFLQGYRAIEKQISNIEQHEKEQHIPLVREIDRIVVNRAFAEMHDIKKLLTPVWEDLPLHDQEFKLVRVALGKTNYSETSKRRMIAVLILLAGT